MCTYLSQFAGFFAFLARFGLIGVGGFGKDHAGCHSSETGSALSGLGRGSVKNEAELLLFIQHLYAWPRPLQTILGLTKAPLGRTPPLLPSPLYEFITAICSRQVTDFATPMQKKEKKIILRKT